MSGLFLLAALLAFLFAAFGTASAGPLQLVPLGLALWVLAELLPLFWGHLHARRA